MALLFTIAFRILNTVSLTSYSKLNRRFYLYDELTHIDYFGSMLFLITWLLTFGCILIILRDPKHSSFLRLLTTVIAFLRANVYFALNILEFYVRFELTLFPILLIIIGWGYQPERFSAGFALIIYTIVGSLPFFIILILISLFNIMNFNQLFITPFNLSNSLLTFFFVIAFLVKLPIFSLHSWLPKAHVEAPVYGSIFLAGTLLKLGGIGLFRIRKFISLYWGGILIILALLALVLIGFICLIVTDIKVLIAYSSVAHIGLAIIMALFLSQSSWVTSLIVYITHGLSSSTIFLVAYLIYRRSNTRRIIIRQNITLTVPTLTLIWFIRCVGLLGGPPASTLLRELIGFSIIFANWFPASFFLIIGAFCGGAYSIMLYVRSAHGLQRQRSFSYKVLLSNELLVSFYHLFWLIFYFLLFFWLTTNFLVFCIITYFRLTASLVPQTNILKTSKIILISF